VRVHLQLLRQPPLPGRNNTWVVTSTPQIATSQLKKQTPQLSLLVRLRALRSNILPSSSTPNVFVGMISLRKQRLVVLLTVNVGMWAWRGEDTGLRGGMRFTSMMRTAASRGPTTHLAVARGLCVVTLLRQNHVATVRMCVPLPSVTARKHHVPRTSGTQQVQIRMTNRFVLLLATPPPPPQIPLHPRHPRRQQLPHQTRMTLRAHCR
jgi:hypothetical protein